MDPVTMAAIGGRRPSARLIGEAIAAGATSTEAAKLKGQAIAEARPGRLCQEPGVQRRLGRFQRSAVGNSGTTQRMRWPTLPRSPGSGRWCRLGATRREDDAMMPAVRRGFAGGVAARSGRRRRGSSRRRRVRAPLFRAVAGCSRDDWRTVPARSGRHDTAASMMADAQQRKPPRLAHGWFTGRRRLRFRLR